MIFQRCSLNQVEMYHSNCLQDENEDKDDEEKSQELQKNKIEKIPPEDSGQQVLSAGPQCPQQDPSVPQQDSRVPNQVAHGNLMGIELMTALGMVSVVLT